MSQSLDQRSIEQAAERAVTRIPTALWALIAALLTQTGGYVWYSATQAERIRALAEVVQKIERKVDSISETQITARDMSPLSRQIDDHETRIRELERRTGGATK